MAERAPYPSDLTDEEWACILPYLPEPAPTGRALEYPLREIANAIFYLNKSGCQWRMIPHDLVPWHVAYYHFSKWEDDGTWAAILDALRAREREEEGRDPKPSAVVVDSQSVPTRAHGAARGYDGGKKIWGRKRHLLTDTLGLLVCVLVTAAGVHDADAARPLFERAIARGAVARVARVGGDTKYGHKGLPAWVEAHLNGAQVETKKRPPDAEGFVVIPKRWVVERTNAWSGGARRLSKDYEVAPRHSEAMIRIAHIRILLKRRRLGYSC